ncbi:MAG: GNAT family N-acetyltransferase [Anaerolineae bacterium]|nr:GNAT family N-acetyltransferase [Anaerolineae bacterium]
MERDTGPELEKGATMQVHILTGRRLAEARAWAGAHALEQALLLADLTQLASDSLPAGAWADGRLTGVACCYTGLPFLAVALWSEAPEVAAALLEALAARQPRLRREPVYALVSEDIRDQLAVVAEVDEVREEVKRVFAPARLAPASAAAARWRPVPLTRHDLPALEELHRSVPPMAWTPRALDYGPCRGIYADRMLVAAAGVHFSTPEVTEVGHIVTHPDWRRRGMAEAVVRALLVDLQGRTGHIFLMHFADNQAAESLYARLGFAPQGQLFLTRFRLQEHT